jgi:hypothetical protein
LRDPTALRRAIEEEWDKITLDEINKAISTCQHIITGCAAIGAAVLLVQQL